MKIRRLLRRDDLAPAIGLLQRFFREEGFTTPDTVIDSRLRKMAELETCGIFVAEAGGQAIGVSTVSTEFGIEFGWWAEMGDLYVLPEWRGKGVSKALVSAGEDWLREKGAAGYQVTVTDDAQDRHDLNRFYEKMGFSGEGRRILFKSF